jgi:hypothetical protein
MSLPNQLIKRIPIILLLLASISLTGCYDHRVNTFPKWCAQITGENLAEKLMPFWAVTYSVSFDYESIMDDYAKFLNEAHLEKVKDRTPKMAWREGANLHLINLSSLFEVQPDEVVNEWVKGIVLAKEQQHKEKSARCLYDTLAMFDNLNIHAWTSDSMGIEWTIKETIIIDTKTGEQQKAF